MKLNWQFIKISFLLTLAFALWCFSFHRFLLNQVNLQGDATVYYEHFRFFLENIGRGVFPMWESSRQNGVPVEFFLRRIGEFNPLFLFIIILNKTGIPYTFSYLIFLALYYFLGMIGFYKLAKCFLRDTPMAFAATVLLMFSSLGTQVFWSFIILIFTPMAWFFYFLVAFTQKPQKHLFLGVIFTVMILVTTYVPFYFLTIFLSFMLCFSFIYFSFLKRIALQYFGFFKEYKIFSCLCILALIASLLPGIFFYQESSKGEFVLPARHAKADTENTLAVGIQKMGGSAVEVASLFGKSSFDEVTSSGETPSLSSFGSRRHASRLKKIRLGEFYVPVFVWILLLIGLTVVANRKLILLASWGFIIYLISLHDTTPLYRFLYEHIFYFKYFRNFEFFLWIILLPITILFLIEQLRLFLSYFPKTKNGKYIHIAFLTAVHLGVMVFLYTQGRGLLSSYCVVGLSLLFFTLWFNKFSFRKKIEPFFLGIFFILIIIQPLEVYHYLSGNYAKGSGSYRYGETRPYLGKLLSLSSLYEQNSEGKKSIPNVIIQKLSPNIYFATKWYYRLHEKLDTDIFDRYKSQPFILYDSVEWIDPDEFLSDMKNIKKMEDAFKDRQNIAFVSRDRLKQAFLQRTGEDVPFQAQIPMRFSQQAKNGPYKFTIHDFSALNKTKAEVLKDINNLIRVINRDTGGEEKNVQSFQEGVDWLNGTEKPFKLLQCMLKIPWNKLGGEEQSLYRLFDKKGGLFERIGRKYGNKPFHAMSDEQLQALAQNSLGQQLKRLILEHHYHRETPRSFRILDFDVNSLKLRTNFSSPKFLVYNDAFHSGWQVFINGKKTDLFQANIAFKGMRLPSGDNIVDFRFGQKWQYILKYLMMGIFQSVFFFFLLLSIKAYRFNTNMARQESSFQKNRSFPEFKRAESSREDEQHFGGIKWLYQGIPVLYLVIFLSSQVIVDQKKVEMGVKGRILNKMNPGSFDYLLNVAQDKDVGKKKLEKYKRYYKLVTQSFPHIAEAYGMLGFCHYYLGEYKEAETAYKEAIKRNSHFFWFYHNLGVIYANKGYYKEAMQVLNLAMKAKPKYALKFIRSSQMIYIPIMRSKVKDPDYSIRLELQKGYQNCYNLLTLIKASIKKHALEDGLANEKIELAIY